MLSTTSAWAAGDGGLILVSTDGGATWNARHAAGVTETLRALHFPTAARGWAVGDAGRVVATADSGATWAPQAAPAGTTASLRAVRFAPDAAHGWAVGDGATILATANGGTSWTAQPAPAGVDATLRGVDVVDPTTAWAVGDRGTVLRTTDGGATWAVVAPDPAWAGDRPPCRTGRQSASGARVAGDLSVLATVAIAGGVPTWQPSPALPGRDLSISAGRIYVDGNLVELEAPARYLAQPNVPGAAFPGAGTYRSYLDVWTRHLTALDRPELREVALGGPDTATRTQTVWQVRIEPTPLGPQPSCASLPAGWRPGDVSGARLRARGAPTPVSTNDCLVPAGGGYRRLENLLYRVEVLTPGAAGTATYTWSRDNGAVVARLATTDPAGNTVTVDDPGRDPGGDFAGAALVELTDDARLLAGQRGVLLTVQGVTGPVIQVTGGTPAASAFGPGAIVRRWDGTGTVSTGGWQGLAQSDGAVAADGIDVEFAGDDFLAGDYWTFPARTLTGGVEWPAVDGAQQFLARDGDAHHYAQLGIVTVGATGVVDVVSDCRVPFAPLTELDLLVYSSGDGQEVPGGGPLTLPDPAVVAVMRGSIPVPNAHVSFSPGGGSKVNGSSLPVVVLTDAHGLAAATWELEDVVDPEHLTAQLADASGAPLGTPVTFQARVRNAASISYEPTCPDLASATTVQAAIDALCARPSGGAGCCHLVGKTGIQAGEYERLDVALKELMVGRKEVDVCICLLPGEYEVPASYLRDVLAEAGDVDRLEIGGAGARLRLVPDAPITGARRIAFHDLELVTSDGSAAAFADTPDQAPDDRMAVDVIGVTIRATEVPNGAALLSFDLCGAVRITGCELTTTGRSTSKVHDVLPGELSAFFDAAATADPATLRKAYATLFTQPLDARVTLSKELETSIEKNPDAFGGDVGTIAKGFVDALQAAEAPVPNPQQLAKLRSTWTPLLNALAGAITFPSAVAFASVCTDVVLSGNRIQGGVSLAGPGRNPAAELAIETALRGHGLSPAWSGTGRLHLDANALEWIGLGSDAAAKLADAGGDVAKAQLLNVAFGQVLLTNNTFSGAPIAVLGETVSVSGNVFEVGAAPIPVGAAPAGGSASRLGFVASVAGAVTGNIGPARSSRPTDAVAELVLDGTDRGAAGFVRMNVV